MADYQRKAFPLFLRGLTIATSPDRLPDGFAAHLQNLRCVVQGEWRQRPGLTAIGDLAAGTSSSATSLFSIPDSASASGFTLFATTADGAMYKASGSPLTIASPAIASGFGAEGVSFVTARPDRSPNPFGFVSSSTQTRKLSPSGAVTEWGLAAPTRPVTSELTRLAYKSVEEFNSTSGFTASSGTLTAKDRLNPASPAVVALSGILYDTASPQTPSPTGWASVVPDQTKFAESIQSGMFMTFAEGATTETSVLDSVYPEITATTIQQIAYDSGTSGLCTIQLTASSSNLRPNCILFLESTVGQTTTSELVRVLSVTPGLSGVPSIRVSTQGTHIAGATVTGRKSFRVYLTNNFSTSATITASYLELEIAAAGLITLTKTTNLDLSTVSIGGQTSRPIQPEDLIHLSLQVTDFSKITEIQLQFDCDAATNDFTRNYFFKSIRPPDIQAAINQTASSLTAQQIAIQRQQLDAYVSQLQSERAALEQELLSAGGGYGDYSAYDWRRQRIQDIDNDLATRAGYSGYGDTPDAYQPPPTTTPGITGSSQWSELKLSFGSFYRVGSDSSRGWRDIKAFRVTIKTGTDVTGLKIGLDSLWVGGTYGILANSAGDVSSTTSLTGINYVYRARNTVTGTRSNPSPPMRSLMFPERQSITVTIPTTTYPDTQADVFDVFRIGGTLANYHYVGTAVKPGGQTNAEFVDTIPDEIAVTQALLEVDRFKPWIQPAAPVSGTCNVVGTRVTQIAGGSFSTRWVRGTVLLIDGKAYTLYTSPASSTVLELNESAGTLTSVRFEVPEPLLDGQALPVIFGPFGTGSVGEFIFGLGDPVNPGYLYWTNGNDPESCSDVNTLEVSSPSEPLINGTVLDGIVYVWSDRRSWRILPSFSGGATGGGSMFYAQETAMGKGLAARWGLATGDNLYFVSWDGIYASRGDAVESLTDDSLAPLFKRDGVVYTEATTYSGYSSYLRPLSFSASDLAKARLTYTKDGLFFTYVCDPQSQAETARYITLYYSFLTKGWVTDSYCGASTDPLSNYTRTLSTFHRVGGRGIDLLTAGSVDGKLYHFDTTKQLDDTYPINCLFDSGLETFGDTRSLKQLMDVKLDLDIDGRPVQVIRIDGPSPTSSGATATIGVNTDYERKWYTLDTSGTTSYNSGFGIQVFWTSVEGSVPKLYEWQPSVLPKGISTSAATDWIRPAGGRAFWCQGMFLTAIGTGTLIVEKEDGGVLATLEISHPTEQTRPYTWPAQPVRQVRLRGATASDNFVIIAAQMEGKSDSDLAIRWDTQATSLGLPGYFHIRDMLVAYESTTPISLTIFIEGVAQETITLPSTGGRRLRHYFPVPATKGKYFRFILTSAGSNDEPFRLFLNDCEVRAKPWGVTNTPYQIFRPFGDATFDGGDGARI